MDTNYVILFYFIKAFFFPVWTSLGLYQFRQTDHEQAKGGDFPFLFFFSRDSRDVRKIGLILLSDAKCDVERHDVSNVVLFSSPARKVEFPFQDLNC